MCTWGFVVRAAEVSPAAAAAAAATAPAATEATAVAATAAGAGAKVVGAVLPCLEKLAAAAAAAALIPVPTRLSVADWPDVIRLASRSRSSSSTSSSERPDSGGAWVGVSELALVLVLRMRASRDCALMRFVASDMAMAASEWTVMSFSALFMRRGEPGSSLMNQAMAAAAACQWGLFHFPVLVDLKMNSRARFRSSAEIMVRL